MGVVADELEETVVKGGDGALSKLADENATGDPFDEAHDAVFAALSDDSIDLPVSNLPSTFRCCRSL